MPRVFISYRRSDAAGQAGRLAENLFERLGRGNVFLDVDAIPAGVDFEQHIDHMLDGCAVALILIGDEWLALGTPGGAPRLHDESDLVRKEVVRALTSGVTVVPVLVEGARMPAAAELPPDVAPIVKLNAAGLDNRHWRQDVRSICDTIDAASDLGRATRLLRRLRRWPGRSAVAGAVVVAVVAVGAIVLVGGGNAPVATAADHLVSCERDHGLTANLQSRPARPSDFPSGIQAQLAQSEAPGNKLFSQTAFASCSWPPAPGATVDGFLAVVVALTNGPGSSEASGTDDAWRIVAPCTTVGLRYAFRNQGSAAGPPEFQAQAGQIWGTNGNSFSELGVLPQAPFTPLASEIDVLTNSTYAPVSARCIG
jgi:hypothetical protein